MSKFSSTAAGGFDRPQISEEVFPLNAGGTQHLGILTNFVEAILDGVPLLAPATEGIHSVELANAMLLSSFENETISLPLDSLRYESFLRRKISESQVKPAGAVVSATTDFSKSFNT